MKHIFSARESSRRTTGTTDQDAAVGPDGVSIAPPDYGIDVVDSQVVQAMPAQGWTHWPSTSENNTGLPDTLKAGIENLSGLSMDDVRVHYNSPKPARLQAMAYTQGTEIDIGPGQDRQLPHEAWHVVQQKQGRVRATTQAKGVGINDDARLEREADVMGARAAGMAQYRPLQRKAPLNFVALADRNELEGGTIKALHSKAGVIQGDFWTDYQKHRMLKNRAALPANRRIWFKRGEIALEASLNNGLFTEVGYMTYSIGPLPNAYHTGGLQSVPALLDAPAIFIIDGFYSHYEHVLKGVGGALLNSAVKLAEMRDCSFFVVVSSINDEVYEAFGFKPADKLVGTWYASTAFMKTRTKSYATPTTGARFV